MQICLSIRILIFSCKTKYVITVYDHGLQQLSFGEKYRFHLQVKNKPNMIIRNAGNHEQTRTQLNNKNIYWNAQINNTVYSL